LEAYISDCGGIYEGHQLLDVVDQEAVEEIRVIRFEGREVEVFVNVGSTAVDHSQSPNTLSFGCLENMRN
jgi:hypothetical protein